MELFDCLIGGLDPVLECMSVSLRKTEKERLKKKKQMRETTHVFVCLCASLGKYDGSAGTETPNECVFVLQTPHTFVYLNMG